MDIYFVPRLIRTIDSCGAWGLIDEAFNLLCVVCSLLGALGLLYKAFKKLGEAYSLHCEACNPHCKAYSPK